MGEETIRGFGRGLITVPGGEPRPAYDLIRTRARIAERRAPGRAFRLTLVPMVDLFAVLVIVLLMNFSSAGEAFFLTREATLPGVSTGEPLRSLPLLTLAAGKVTLESESEVGFDGEDLRTPDLPLLRETLRRMKAAAELRGIRSARLNVQADGNTPLEDVKLVMRVLAEEGWAGLNFVLAPPGS